MSAKEMFEELGYEGCIDTILEQLVFENGSNYIAFWLDNKTFFKQCGYEPGDITLQELKAINKQIEELGWK
jgi:hypothetical protein